MFETCNKRLEMRINYKSTYNFDNITQTNQYQQNNAY